jgi:hypothetical protein
MPHDNANTVTWTNDIQKMFTAIDISAMKTYGIDLSNYDSVKNHANAIYTRVKNHSMPCAQSGEQPWSDAWVATFLSWIQQKYPM